MTGLGFGPDGTSKCKSCGEDYNSITSYDFSGKLCNKCYDAKKDTKQESEQESEQDSGKDMFGFGGGSNKDSGKGMFGFGGM